KYLVDEVVGYFGAHPAIGAWQIGDGLERVRKPASMDAVAAWYTTMADAVRARRSRVSVLGVTSARGIHQFSGPRPEQIAQACDMLGISAYPPETPGDARRHTSWPLFLTTLAMALAERPVLATSLALPTTADTGGEWRSERVYGRQRSVFYGDQEQQATFLEVALERLYQAGASGAWLAGYADYGPEHWRTPPLDRAPFERPTGLVDAQGAEKQSVRAVQQFAQRIKASETRPAPHIDGAIDPERYWHNPAQRFAELWADFDNEN
ncbi:MAG TPA: hypothetical protein VFT99_23705, partial [Roseiflexaceae bacterium]|nr:hypothetical protein [Roseiflexaceae bacterium]